MAATLQPEATPSPSPSATADLSALWNDAGVSQLDDTGWVRVAGADRVRWLNGMVTNAIQGMAPGSGRYSFVLNSQGRILGDLTAFLLEDFILLETSRSQVPTLLEHLDRFIIMDDVELADISDQRTGLLIAGAHALRAIQQLDGMPCSTRPPAQLPRDISLKHTTYHDMTVDLIHAYSPLIPRFEVWADADTMRRISADVMSLPTLSADCLEALRILEGTPRYGTDIRNNRTAHDLPQETTQSRALNFSKGCYLGQEIVERIRSRGNVHRSFCGFELTGTLPVSGVTLQAEGKPAGELTSVAAIGLPSGPAKFALGYIRREALDRSLALDYPGGAAQPVTLPFRVS